jgi:hypothetical protein
MNKHTIHIATLILLMATPASAGAVSVSRSVIGTGGATMDGSHRVVGTVGQWSIGTQSGSHVVEPGFWYAQKEAASTPTSVEGLPPIVAPRYEYRLDQNAPNPFNPLTTIRFALAEPGQVRMNVYDVEGREVMTVVDGAMAAGPHELLLDADDLASGVYFYRINSGRFSAVKKMVLLK